MEQYEHGFGFVPCKLRNIAKIDKLWRRLVSSLWREGVVTFRSCAGHYGTRNYPFLAWPEKSPVKVSKLPLDALRVVLFNTELRCEWELRAEVTNEEGCGKCLDWYLGCNPFESDDDLMDDEKLAAVEADIEQITDGVLDLLGTSWTVYVELKDTE
jgi:hypothetical protein